MWIRVTAKDIKAGRANDCHRCPVARAARRELGNGCAVDGEEITKNGWAIKLPQKVKDFIKAFDFGRTIVEQKPFSFQIRRPS